MGQQMRIKIMGKYWELRFVPNLKNHGDIDPPSKPKKAIRIKSTLVGAIELETIIHEIVHAGNWHLDEEFVEPFCHDLARILWKLGYRNKTRINKVHNHDR